MSASTIGIIFTAIVALILASSIFFGAKRGLNKTLFRFFWLILTLLGLYFTTPMISNLINSIDISSLDLDIYGKVTKLSDIGSNIVKELTAGQEALENSTALQTFAQNLPAMIINIFVFVIAFWLLKALLYPFWAFLSSRMFDKQEREQKKFKKQQAKLRAKNKGVLPPQEENTPILLQVKRKKNGWGGAVVGIFIGLMLCAVTFSPIVGLNAIYQNVYTNLKTQEDGKEVYLIENIVEDKQVLEYISCYENSIANKVLTYTGSGFISNAMFDGLATVEVNNEKVYLDKEIETAVKIYSRYETIKNFDSENITQDSLRNVLSAITETFIDLKGSKIIYLLGDDILPYILEDFLNDEDFKLIDGAELDELLVLAFNSYKDEFVTSEFQEQVEALVSVAVALNESNLIVPFINNEVKSLQDFVNVVSNSEKTYYLSNEIVDNLYKVDLLSDKYPEIFDEGIKSIFDTLGIEYSTINLNNSSLQQNLKTIIRNTINFIKIYGKSENYDFDKNNVDASNTTEASKCLGTILDTFKSNILGEANYNQFLDYIIEKLNEATLSFADFSGILENLRLVDSWEDELYNVANLYNDTVKLINSNVTFDKILKEDYVYFENLGNGLNSAIVWGKSKIITNETIRDAIEIVLDKIDTSGFNEILTIIVEGDKTLKNTILDNIYDENLKTSSIEDWYSELKYNLNVFRNAYNIISDNFDLSKLSEQENDQLANLGSAIDSAIDNTNLVLSNEVIRNIAGYYLQKVDFGTEVNEILNIVYGTDNYGVELTVYDQILNNIYNEQDSSSTNQDVCWKDEMAKIKNVINATFDTSELKEMGAILDKFSGSRLFTKDVINEVVKFYIDKEVVLLDSGLNNAVSSLKNNLGFVISYEKEFGYILDLVDVLTTNYDNDTARFEAVGDKFNTITNVLGTETQKSNVLTKSIINQFITYYFDTYMEDYLDTNADKGLIGIVDSIKQNLDNIENYKTELLNIINLVDCVDGSIPDVNGDTVNDLKDIGRTLDNLNSKIITTTVIRNLICYYVDKDTSSLDTGLVEIIESIKTKIKDNDIIINSYELEFSYLQSLTNSITADTISYTNIGKSFDEVCNMKGLPGAVASVIISRSDLNAMLSYYFDKFVKDNFTSTTDEDLKNIVIEIKDNISNILSFETEFTYLDSLFGVINKSTTEIGAKFDEIKDNSYLITNKNLNDIVLHFFNKKSSDYANNTDYKDVIADLKNKVIDCTNAQGKVYATMFNELDLVISYVVDFDNLKDVSSFTNPTSIGNKLDAMEDMSVVCDKTITYKCANIIIEKISSSDAVVEAKVNAVLTSDIFDFANYNTDSFKGSYNGTNYYTDLMTAIKNAIETQS